MHELHTQGGLFSSAFGEKQMSSSPQRGMMFDIVHLTEDGKKRAAE